MAPDTLARIGLQHERVAPAPVSWTADPIAARILADLAKNPPPLRVAYAEYAHTRDEWVVYEGNKVSALRSIYERYAAAAVEAVDGGDRSLWESLRLTDPAYRDGDHSVPKYLWLSSPVDRVVFEAVQGRVS